MEANLLSLKRFVPTTPILLLNVGSANKELGNISVN